MIETPLWQTMGVKDAAGIAISLFSGAGGLDIGAEAAGYEVRAAVEINQDAADTLEKNFPNLTGAVIRRNIFEVPTRELVRAAGLRGRERPDILIGGPPCTPFSKSGFWLEWKRSGLDPDASLLQAYTRVLADARPRAFMLENVYALTYQNRASKPAFDRLLREITDAGYVYRYAVLNAADFGVPQLRPRLFVVGVPRGKKLPEFPEATHSGKWERRPPGNGPLPHVTAGEALAGLMTEPESSEQVRGKWGHLLPGIPPGSNYLHYTANRGCQDPIFEWRSRYWSFLLKLSPDRPAPTIQSQPGPNVGPFHWENRRLRVDELKRLFTFPDEYEFIGRRTSVQSQIGNAVPCLLAQRVLEQVRYSVHDNS